MVTKGLNKITQNETQDLQLVDNFCKSWDCKGFQGSYNDINDKVKEAKDCSTVRDFKEATTAISCIRGPY